MMRRRLEFLLPIVLLAVMVQLLAPIAAFRSAAAAAADPQAMSAICSEMASHGDADNSPGQAQHTGDCCSFCAACHVGANPLAPPQPVFVVLQRHYQLVAWLQADAAMPTARVGSNAQARAPPVNS
jgi:hypothetical protein